MRQWSSERCDEHALFEGALKFVFGFGDDQLHDVFQASPHTVDLIHRVL